MLRECDALNFSDIVSVSRVCCVSKPLYYGRNYWCQCPMSQESFLANTCCQHSWKGQNKIWNRNRSSTHLPFFGARFWLQYSSPVTNFNIKAGTTYIEILKPYEKKTPRTLFSYWMVIWDRRRPFNMKQPIVYSLRRWHTRGYWDACWRVWSDWTGGI